MEVQCEWLKSACLQGRLSESVSPGKSTLECADGRIRPEARKRMQIILVCGWLWPSNVGWDWKAGGVSRVRNFAGGKNQLHLQLRNKHEDPDDSGLWLESLSALATSHSQKPLKFVKQCTFSLGAFFITFQSRNSAWLQVQSAWLQVKWGVGSRPVGFW